MDITDLAVGNTVGVVDVSGGVRAVSAGLCVDQRGPAVDLVVPRRESAWVKGTTSDAGHLQLRRGRAVPDLGDADFEA